MSELPMTATDAAALLRAGDVSSVELTAPTPWTRSWART